MSQLVERSRHGDVRAELLRVRQRMEVDTLDYKRTLKAAAGCMSQREMAEVLGMSQPAVAKALQRAASVPEVLAGHEAASPYEVCQRYAAGLIDRDKAIQELVAWPYPATPSPDEYGDYSEPIEGSFFDVVHARHMGLIEKAMYSEIVKQMTA